MVLISILGDFHSSILPIYAEMSLKINKHILVYDDAKHDKKEAKNILKGLERYNKKHLLNIELISNCIDEDSLDSLQTFTQYIQTSFKVDEVWLNTTDGLANINSYISSQLLPLGYKFISYDRYDNEVNILSKDDMQKYAVENTISIKDHFLLKNIKVETSDSKKFPEQNSTLIKKLFENHLGEFRQFVQFILNPNNMKNNQINLKQSRFQNVNKILKSLGVTNKTIRSQQNFITGKLFEYYIYLLVKDFSCDDIEIGLTIKQKIKDDIYYIPNEFDILIMKNNHLHMIECKFTNAPIENLVYKYMGLKQLLDDDGKILITTMNPHPDNLFEPYAPTKHLPYKRAQANSMHLNGDPFKNIAKFKQTLKDFFEI